MKIDNRRGVLWELQGNGPTFHGTLRADGRLYETRGWYRRGPTGKGRLDLRLDLIPKRNEGATQDDNETT